MKYKVFYNGWYLIEADSAVEAVVTDRNDAEVECDEWENYSAVKAEED